jgi:hypothetical protein
LHALAPAAYHRHPVRMKPDPAIAAAKIDAS